MSNLVIKIQKAFAIRTGSSVYGRDAEKKRIREFLEGSGRVLHITGKPGTGKTCTVMEVLREHSYEYVNYYHTPEIGSALRNCSSGIVVIDEFDKFFAEKKTACMRAMIDLGHRGIKLVTISNNLRMGNLVFAPYTTQNIYDIIQAKIKEEIGEQCIEDAAILYIAKKYNHCGDLRTVFKALLDLIFKKADDGTDALQLRDCITTALRNPGEKNLHHQIVCKMAKNAVEQSVAYNEFAKECAALNIPTFDRQEFFMIYKMYLMS